MGGVTPLSLAALFICLLSVPVHANPYVSKPGEKPVTLRIATCAVSGGFAHLYTALDNGLFDKYSFKMEHVYIRGSGPALAALLADEIQFLYCAADATLPSLATGVDVNSCSALGQIALRAGHSQRNSQKEDLKGKAQGRATG
jgi:ABC-type nitrate/sulfonate/bicarbonate transport system substrate-binding protein